MCNSCKLEVLSVIQRKFELILCFGISQQTARRKFLVNVGMFVKFIDKKDS